MKKLDKVNEELGRAAKRMVVLAIHTEIIEAAYFREEEICANLYFDVREGMWDETLQLLLSQSKEQLLEAAGDFLTATQRVEEVIEINKEQIVGDAEIATNIALFTKAANRKQEA